MPYQPLEDFETTDADRSSRRIRDMSTGKARYSLTVYPESLTFPETGTGQESVPQTVLLMNSGYDALPITSIAAIGEFVLQGVAPTEVGPGETTSIQVVFSPSSVGAITGGIYIDTGNAAGKEFVSLSGSGAGELTNPVITAFGASILLLEDAAGLQDLVLPVDIADVTGLQDALDGVVVGEHTHEIADVTGLQSALDGKADDAHNHTIADVTALQAALDAKAAASHTHAIADTTGLQAGLDAKAPLASPTFTGTVSGITKAMVGLGSVDDTSDASKPVSTAQQTALDLKANLASPALTGTPTAPTATGGTNTTQIATTAFIQSALGSYQPLDGDLTAIAALTTTAYGRALLESVNEAGLKATLNLEAGTDFLSPSAIAAAYQPLDGDLTSIAALTTTSLGRDLLTITSSSVWPGITPCDIPLSFDGTPTASQLIGKLMVARDTDFEADFAGSVGHVGTNPTSTFAIDVQDDGVSIGTISISTGGTFTFTTASGTAKTVAAGSRIEFYAPAGVDATIATIAATLKGSV